MIPTLQITTTTKWKRSFMLETPDMVLVGRMIMRINQQIVFGTQMKLQDTNMQEDK